MKVKITFLALALIIFASCEGGNHKEIRNAFRQYVNENFGNPKDMKEITLIEFKDTINISEIRDEICEIRKSVIDFLKSDSLFINKRDSMIDLVPNSDVEYETVQFWIENPFLVELGKMFSEEKRRTHVKLRESIKTKIQESHNLPYYYIHYLIKARIFDGEKNIVREFHAYKDSIGKIYIKDELMNIAEYSGVWGELMSEAHQLILIVKEERKNVERIKYMLNNMDW